MNIESLIKDLQKSVKPQSLNARVFNGRAKEFDPAEHEVLGESTDHYHYNCPFCLEERGKEDDDGKFYWNFQKFVGWCFKCKTIGFLKTDKPIEQVKIDMMLQSFISNASRIEYELMREIFNSSISFNCLDFSSKLSERALNYLDERIPFYSEVAEALGFTEVSETGVLIPTYIRGQCKSYNIRLYNPTGKMKYYLAKNVEKYPYSPTRVFDKAGSVGQITLVEGAFDALGAYFDGYSNPIALNGLSITPMIAFLLKTIIPESVVIYLDDEEKSQKIKRDIRRIFPTVSSIRVRKTWGQDPEEVFKYKLGRASPEYLLGVLERINKLKELNNEST